MLTKTVFVKQSPKDPACFGAVAAMAVGSSLEDFKLFIGRDSNEDQKPYSLKEVARWLFYHDMTFTPGGYLYNHVVYEECPGVELKVTIDADIMQILNDYAEQLEMSLETAVNGLLCRVLQDCGAKTRQGFRYLAPSGYGASFFQKQIGYLKYVVPINQPAIVAVKSSADFDHALYWDGALLWDSARPEEDNPVSLDEYTVYAWHPIGKFKENGGANIPQGFIPDDEPGPVGEVKEKGY